MDMPARLLGRTPDLAHFGNILDRLLQLRREARRLPGYEKEAWQFEHRAA
jgi:hypothetical protein